MAIFHINYRHITCALLTLCTTASFAAETATTHATPLTLPLARQPGFFRFSFDNVKMPDNIQDMGLLGVNYFADITPNFYGGVGAYGAVTGSQGGLFTLGVAGGFHHTLIGNWMGDIGLFAGGGGGKSSLVGGGFMLRPSVGIGYSWQWARLGAHYSYIDFPSGEIRSQQIGLDLDLPFDFYTVPATHLNDSAFHLPDFAWFKGKYLNFERNDFSLLLSAYHQRAGTLNNNGEVQDGTIGLVGAELDHYLNENVFWSFRADGAFRGIPNGYMDVLAGLGYRFALGKSLALVPQMDVGAGGGGYVDTGGGVLLQPQLGFEVPLTTKLAARLNGGYLWSPKGQLRAYTASAALIYHLDIATVGNKPASVLMDPVTIQGWRIGLFNQTYLHPQRTHTATTSAINLIALQIDQLITKNFFFSYQATSAYTGNHAGGLATGMIGPGLQTPAFFNNHLQLFAELLAGAGGGGGLALGGGAIIEPVVGVHYALTPTFGLQASYSQMKAIGNPLNTPVVNVGLTIRFGTLDRG